MVRNKQQTQEKNEQYVRATFSHFLTGNPTYIIRDETGQILAMAMGQLPPVKTGGLQTATRDQTVD